MRGGWERTGNILEGEGDAISIEKSDFSTRGGRRGFIGLEGVGGRGTFTKGFVR